MRRPKQVEYYGFDETRGDLVYTGQIPSIVGLNALIVVLDHKETLIYTRKELVEAKKAKYSSGFRKCIGEILADPYEHTRIARRWMLEENELESDEFDFAIQMADAGLMIDLDEENDRLRRRFNSVPNLKSKEPVYRKEDYVKSDEESDEKLGGLNIDLDKILRGVRTLAPKEREVFKLWESGVKDNVAARQLGLKSNVYCQHKYKISSKLRLFYDSASSQKFESDIQRVFRLLKARGLDSVSDQVPVEYRKTGRKPSQAYIPIQSPRGITGRVDQICVNGRNAETASVNNDLLTVGEDVSEIEKPTPQSRVITFNDFLQAFGNRKDAVKALDHFNKLNILERQRAYDFIPQYKRSLSNITFQISPSAYLLSVLWRNSAL